MLCKKVIPLLSEFFDEALDMDTSIRVSQHLGQCISCRKEFDSIADLHKKLRSLDRVQAPEYLQSLVQHRLAQQPWRARLRDELERYWSIIRTTEAMWYATRTVGTVIAAFFFLLVPSTLTPFYMRVEAQVNSGYTAAAAYESGRPGFRKQVKADFREKMGMLPEKRHRSVPAEIHPLYLLEYGQTMPRAGKDDTLAVSAKIDSSGAARVETVLEHPVDGALLQSFTEVLTSARFRPASQNGQAVTSHIVFSFSRVFVSD